MHSMYILGVCRSDWPFILCADRHAVTYLHALLLVIVTPVWLVDTTDLVWTVMSLLAIIYYILLLKLGLINCVSLIYLFIYP